MAIAAEFNTIVEMFDAVTTRFRSEGRSMLMYKTDGKYRGIGFADMRDLVEKFANGLAAIGVKENNNISLISENRPEWVVADMAILKLGAVNVSIYPTLTAKQIEYILKDAEVKYAIVSNQMQLTKILKIIDDVPTLRRIITFTEVPDSADHRIIAFSTVLEMGSIFHQLYPDHVLNESKKVTPDHISAIIYTSGTTGNPKGVMLTHCNIVSNIKAASECIPFSHEDTILSFLPLSHSYERTAGYYTAMSCGALIAYAESIDTVPENLMEVKPTFVTTVPRLFERFYNRLMKQMSEEPILRQKIFQWAIGIGKTHIVARKNRVLAPLITFQYRIADKLVFRKIRERTGGKIKFFVSGGAALSAELGEFFESIGIKIIEGYGMTEASPVISVNRLDKYRWGSVGIPLPGVDVKIAPDGEILVRGRNVMKGYWQNPQATSETIDSENWLHTGDIGLVDEDGFLKITDRKKHLFVSSGGKNIAPQHIENLLLQSNLIDQIVLIGEGRMYITALIVPDFDFIRKISKQNGWGDKTNEELALDPNVYDYINKEINKIQRDLAAYERVRKFTILQMPLTIENDELTPSLKVRRRFVENKFKNLIDKMYEGIH
jgi:long-chain acyl-CoA synthetase